MRIYKEEESRIININEYKLKITNELVNKMSKYFYKLKYVRGDDKICDYVYLTPKYIKNYLIQCDNAEKKYNHKLSIFEKNPISRYNETIFKLNPDYNPKFPEDDDNEKLLYESYELYEGDYNKSGYHVFSTSLQEIIFDYIYSHEKECEFILVNQTTKVEKV